MFGNFYASARTHYMFKGEEIKKRYSKWNISLEFPHKAAREKGNTKNLFLKGDLDSFPVQTW